MRTLEILPHANQAPLISSEEIGQMVYELGRALNIVLLAGVITLALSGFIESPDLNRFMLIGAGGSLSVVLIFPMFKREGLDTMQVRNEMRGTYAFILCMAIGMCMMKTFGDVVFAGEHPAMLLTLLAVPMLVKLLAAMARHDGFIKGVDA